MQASYEFDRALRDLITEALEVIELDVRTAIAYHFGQQHGPFGHTAPANFYAHFNHQAWTDARGRRVPGWIDKLHEEAERSRELFVTHYRATYAEFPGLPIWMATEVMSFGALSQMFKGMLRPDQKGIASRYGRQPTDLASWLHHMVYVRNMVSVPRTAGSAAEYARLKDFYRQAQDYGAGGIKSLENGRFRFYGELDPARTPGEMAGRRLVREWDPMTDNTRTWHETLDNAGIVRQVRPEPRLPQNHFVFDAEGNYVGTR